MKTLKFILAIVAICISLCSCAFSSDNKTDDDFSNQYTGQNFTETTDVKKQKTGRGVKYFNILDKSNGLISNRIPYPSNWKMSKQKETAFTGPNNIKVSGTQGLNFMFTNNQDTAWILQQQGQKNVPPMSIDQIIEKFFMPVAKQTNRTLVEKIELPKLAEKAKNFMSLLFVSIPVQREAKCYGLEWKDDKGMSYFTIITINIAYSQPSSSWNIFTHYVEAPNKYFNKAKEAFLYAQLNNQHNPQWLYAVNKRDAERAGRSYRAHQGRMAAIRLRGNAAKSISDTYSEISDINHAGYLKRNSINNAGHSKTINAIGDRTVIGNHSTGEHYNVQSGSKHYWVNNNGKYIGTDNSLYDPRLDKNINNTEWTKFSNEN